MDIITRVVIVATVASMMILEYICPYCLDTQAINCEINPGGTIEPHRRR